MLHNDYDALLAQAPKADFWSARFVSARSEQLCVRQGQVEPIEFTQDCGVHLTVIHQGGIGYAAVSNLTPQGIKAGFNQALQWAQLSSQYALFNPIAINTSEHASFQSPIQTDPLDAPLASKIQRLKSAEKALKVDPRILDAQASLTTARVHSMFINSLGARIDQQFCYLVPNLAAVAHDGNITQYRTLNGGNVARQMGLELLDALEFEAQAERIGREALALLLAPNCPDATMDLLLMPDQMMLQIHESIGHPLELDRILGDERNYAGTSFVTLDMFGSYAYGSPLLNITFDPSPAHEFASYQFDDDGTRAERTFLIQDGILQRPLGSELSQQRAKSRGVANARASNWNRPSMDRMANLNLEPGNSSLEEMIGGIQRGILMSSNNSWSIDDSRNKFQFGCEWGQLIENGQLTQVVRNPNYRGISATFWRNLKQVGNAQTFEAFGTPLCGKGEPNQCVRVGHASPACVFADVQVFGGDA